MLPIINNPQIESDTSLQIEAQNALATEADALKSAKEALAGLSGGDDKNIIALAMGMLEKVESGVTKLIAQIEQLKGLISKTEGLNLAMKALGEKMKTELSGLESQLQDLEKSIKTFLIVATKIESNSSNSSDTADELLSSATSLEDKVNQLEKEASELFKSITKTISLFAVSLLKKESPEAGVFISILNSMSLGMGQGELGTPLPTPPKPNFS